MTTLLRTFIFVLLYRHSIYVLSASGNGAMRVGQATCSQGSGFGFVRSPCLGRLCTSHGSSRAVLYGYAPSKSDTLTKQREWRDIMRGSKKSQLTAIIKHGCQFGTSRHKSKQQHGNKSPVIHSYGSFDKIHHRLRFLIPLMPKVDIKEFEEFTNPAIESCLEHRLAYHLEKGNTRHTFQAEISALGNLERCLTMFSAKHRAVPIVYNFAPALKLYMKKARSITNVGGNTSRALPRPLDVIVALPLPRHILMAHFQLQCGCRAEGVGAPRREYIGSNHLKMENFMHPDGGSILTPFPDPITGKPVFRFWSKEKGGKVGWKHCPEFLAREFFTYCEAHPEGLVEHYPVYLGELNAAMKRTGQYAKGRGTHSFRFNFAQARYLACVSSGMGDEEAKLFVSQELNHNRPSVTGDYLR